MRRKLMLFFIITNNIMAYCQPKKNLTSNRVNNMVSIYEVGDSLTSCETNFENLFRNWHEGNITNAGQFRYFGNYSFVETISDSIRYKYYRNYFSGLDVVWNFHSISDSFSYNGKKWESTKKKHKYFATPYKSSWAILDKLPLETMVKVVTLFNTELKLNIDTIKSNAAFQESTHIIEKKQDGISSTSKSTVSTMLVYSDSATKKMIDSMILHNLRFEDLDLQSRDELLTTQYFLWRVDLQKGFNKEVHIGDKVYVVPFGYGGFDFNIFVICNPESKKVVMDYFFKNIRINSSR